MAIEDIVNEAMYQTKCVFVRINLEVTGKDVEK